MMTASVTLSDVPIKLLTIATLNVIIYEIKSLNFYFVGKYKNLNWT